jgi:uncharacterized protein YkwD
MNNKQRKNKTKGKKPKQKRSLKRILLLTIWFCVISFGVLVLGTALFLMFIALIGENYLSRKELLTSTLLASTLLVFILLSVAKYISRFKPTIIRWSKKSLRILAPLVIVPLAITVIAIFKIEPIQNESVETSSPTDSSGLKVATVTPFEEIFLYEDKLNTETNNRRANSGLPTLTLNSKLSEAARAKCADMIKRNYWSHNDPDGKEPWHFLDSAGYSYQWAGENLANGYDTEKKVVDGWMLSTIHKDNILNTNYTEAGYGFCKSENFNNSGKQAIVVQFLGTPKSTSNYSSMQQSTSQTQQSDSSSKCASIFSTNYKTPMISLGTKPTSIYIINYIGEDDYDYEVSKYNNEVAVYNSKWQSFKSKFLNEANIAKCDTSLYTYMMDSDEARPYPVN